MTTRTQSSSSRDAETGFTGVSLERILGLPAVLRGVPEVLSGSEDLGRQVRWVHAGEIPNIATMLKGGELLLTTGLGIGSTGAAQRRFIADLTEHRVAALALELGTQFTEAPRPLIEEARVRGLALIVFHHQIPFIEITEEVHSEILAGQVDLLRRADEVHRRFFALALDGAGASEVIDALSGMLDAPVYLERAGRGLIFHSARRMEEADALAAWESYSRGLGAGRPEAIERSVPVGGDNRWGRVIAIAGDSGFDDHDRVAIEQAVGVIALALLRDREEEAVLSRERGNFFIGLTEGDLEEEDAARRAASLGLRGASRLVPVVVGRSSERGLRADEALSWSLAWQDAQQSMKERSFRFLAGTREEGELIIIVGLDRDGDRSGVLDRVAEQVREACSRRFGSAEEVVICAGAASETWVGLATTLRRTLETSAAAAHLSARPWHDVSRPDLDRTLWALRDDPGLNRFAQTLLEPLIEHDRKGRGELVETLATYCRLAGRKAETARSLSIERQSLYHRLHRIEEILGLDLSDGETLFGLHLALRVGGYLSHGHESNL